MPASHALADLNEASSDNLISPPIKKQMSFSKRMAKQFSFGKKKRSIGGSSRAVTGPTVEEAAETSDKSARGAADAGAGSAPMDKPSSTAEPHEPVTDEPTAQELSAAPAVLHPTVEPTAQELSAAPAVLHPTVDLRRWQDGARAAPMPSAAGFLPSTLIVLLLAFAMYAAAAAGMADVPPPPSPPAIVASRGAPWQPAVRLAMDALKRVRIGR